MINSLEKNINTLKIEDDEFFEALRKKEYNNLDLLKHTYLDFTGGNLYANSQILKHQKMLLENIFGNPHSENPTSKKSSEFIEETRKSILDFFNATEYYCVFTQNASNALKIVGECYPFNEKSTFLLLSDNHNSVNGIREYCKNKNGTNKYVPVQYSDLHINIENLKQSIDETPKNENNLFAFPAQSNVSGVKHDLKWIEYAQQSGFDVLLDAAAFVPTSKLDLSVYHPDYITCSFYKMFGYPTGIGCLLIRKCRFDKLVKPWFAGGTVKFVSVVSQDKYLVEGHERFEDGTLDYVNIPAIKIGLDYLNSIGMSRINKRILSLAHYLFDELHKLHHDNGQSMIKVFGPNNFDNRGGNILINFLDLNGKTFPYEQIEKKCNYDLISIRTGCFCNPGIDEINNYISEDESSEYFISHETGDFSDVINFFGTMRGAIRVSVGIATCKRDLDKFVEAIASFKNQFIDQ